MADIPDIPDSTGGVGIPSGEPPKPGRDFPFPWRLFSALSVFALIVIFALQNTDYVDVNFLFWEFRVRLIIVITFTMVLSVVFGDMIDWWWKRRKRKHSDED